MSDSQRWTYFTDEEVVGLEPEYVAKLDMARAKTIELDPEKKGIAFVITSGFRSVEKNESVIGAVPDSSHCKGLATDLAVDNHHEVFLIVAALISVGINRIGIYVNGEGLPTHVHNDMDTEKPSQTIWLKREGSVSDELPQTA